MAATTTPRSAEPGVEAGLTADGGGPATGGRRVAVAFSGGRDSTALLHATARAAADLGGAVVALHVHHGLHPCADAWLAHVQAQCAAWAGQGWPVSLRWQRLALPARRGDSIEAVARRARYEALASMALDAGCDTVLLGHHRQDQAETFLLQALRGAGTAGLASMPSCISRWGLTWQRPWLQHARQTIEAYVAHHGLAFVDDDSNEDGRYARNRLRHGVWPALHAAFPQAQASLAAAAARQADALACRDEWLAERLPRICQAGEGPHAPRGLLAQAWGACSAAAQRELLRAWFKQESGLSLTAAWVGRLQAEIPRAARQGGRQWRLALSLPGSDPARGVLQLRQGVLRWLRDEPGPGLESAAAATWDDSGLPAFLCIEAQGEVRLPGGLGMLEVTPVPERGVPLAWLASCELRARSGGEQFQLGPGRPPRALKKQYQALHVPAWERQGPLVWSRGQLVFVPGLGVDARAWGSPGEPQVSLAWRPCLPS